MNLKMLLISVLGGILSGLITIYWLPPNLELFLWVFLVLVFSYLVAKYCPKNTFLKGFGCAFLLGILITTTHLLLITDYIQSHQVEITILKRFQITDSIPTTLLLIAPFYWFMLGIFISLLALVWKKTKLA